MHVLPFRTPAEIAAALPGVVDHLRAGGVIAYPTETVYGFGCAVRPDAVARLIELKRRAQERPFLLLVAGAEQLSMLEWTSSARALAATFWPGPLTLALAAPAGAFPPGVRSPDGTVAVRASPHSGVQALLRALGEAITSTSANAPGEAPARNAPGVEAALALLDGGDVLVLDGGELPPSAPSTIVDASVSPLRVVRAGAVPIQKLRTITGDVDAG
jgi:L-threonylcarbamoyladenylate synthase